MNLNAESYFSMTPSLDISRSKFDMSHGIHSSGCVGDIIPIEIMPVYPGDTFEYKTNAIFRLQPLVAPLMDDITVDIYWFYAPMRILWEKTKEFFGENTSGPWAPAVEYAIPNLNVPRKDITSDYSDIATGKKVYLIGVPPKSIGDYLGIPTNTKVTNDGTEAFLTAHPELIYVDDTDYTLLSDNLLIDVLPFRMYGMIYNEYLRSEALQNPVVVPLSSSSAVGFPADTDLSTLDPITATCAGGALLKACKKFDYFTGALPNPQRRADPVMALPNSYVYFGATRDASAVVDAHDLAMSSVVRNTGTEASPTYGRVTNGFTVTSSSQSPSNFNIVSAGNKFQPDNWMIDGVSVEQIRVAFQVQKFYEATARSGGRYREILESLFHVHASDQSMQIPQFLGSEQFYLNINQVLQTSESGTTPQGNPAGISVTQHSGFDFIHSFTEHGYIMGLAIARYHHTYQQGIQRFWHRSNKFDFYFPQFANIGEQPIRNDEIMFTGSTYDSDVFGYQEAWADMRYKPSIVTGEMRSNVQNSLDMYHLADDYNGLVFLGDKWIQEDKKMLDRCLAVTSDVADQFWFDMYFDCKATRPLPVHSIPGLVDHH